MNLKRTSNWVEPETMKQHIHMLQEKSGELAAEQVVIKGAEELVAKELREFEETGKPNREPYMKPDKLKIPLEREMLKKLGYTVTDRTIGSVWETKNRFSFACHLPKEEMRIVYFKAERDAGQNI
ncbi:MAG: hypothetical protein KHX30_01320 [Clostridium sp.]|nr:hypothetical protein [Clostridium sp.]